MNTLLTILGGLSSVFVIVLTIVSAFSLRKPRKISALSAFISGLIALLAMLVMVLIGGLRLNLLLAVPVLLFGMLLGFVRGQLVKFSLTNQQVIGRNSILFIILWGFSLGVSLLLGLLDLPIMASLGLLPVVFSTGLQMGFYVNHFLRRIVIHLTDLSTPTARQSRLATALNLKVYPNAPVRGSRQRTPSRA